MGILGVFHMTNNSDYLFLGQVLKKHEPVYQAVWANNTDFDEVLISPVMIQDHMPDNVLQALNKGLLPTHLMKLRTCCLKTAGKAREVLMNMINAFGGCNTASPPCPLPTNIGQ
uniref:Uncharacterized protein n=2 Tax=Timema TaxID=61471 RepID=A0A7R9APZ1_TIMSH|nr:unnamed protein product [Timema shepardi]CAD7568828.1 unnamed protein product [Timema californicum]